MSSTNIADVVPLWIGGLPSQANPSIRFPVYRGQDQKIVHEAEGSDIVTANQAADVALEAFHSWKKTSGAYRRDLLFRVADIIEARRAELVAVQKLETSCSEAWAHFNLSFSINNIREIGSRITSVCGEIPHMQSDQTIGLVFREPIGPVLLIAPWNASFILSSRGVASIVAAGCTAILKASELCPKTHHFLAEIFKEAGFPDGVINIIQCRREEAPGVTEALISHRAVRKIEFVGSAEVGRIIGALGGKYLKPVLMELGGKCSAIVLDDADLEDAARKCALGAFMHHGQICFGTERIIVLEHVATKFTEILKRHAQDINPGNGVSISVVKKAYDLLRDAKQKGATFILGEPGYRNPTTLVPCLLTGVTREMEIYDRETFGPSASLFIVKDEEEAIKIANDSEYGLNAAIHTTNMQRAINIGRRLEVAQVHVNSLTQHEEPTHPASANKGSGWGRNNARYGIEEFLSSKVLTLNMDFAKLAFEDNKT